MSYILYINEKEKITEIPLSAANNRKIMLDICGHGIDTEVYNGVWKMLSSDKITLKINGKPVSSAEIREGDVINICPENGKELAVMVKKINAEENVFEKYSLEGKDTVSIGRAEDNDIVIADGYVGSHHCTISGGVLTDNSKNGTFINGNIAGRSAKLNIFDTIYITGHKIIFLGSVIAVCKNDKINVKLPKADLAPLVNDHVHEDDSFFSRAPRRIEPLDTEEVEIEDPPQKQKTREQPLIFIIGPSVTMPIPILVSVLVNIASNSGAGRSGIMYLGTALSVVLSALIGTGWALAHQIYNKKQLAADEKERTEAYSEYIENNRNMLEEKHNKNRNILEKSYLSTEELSKMATSKPEILWNRNIYQNDFLTIRLGRGKVKFPAEITVSKQRFSLNNDEMSKYPHELFDKYEKIENCVSLFGILQHKIVGMAGDEDKLPLIVNNMVCQLAALHCYTDVKIGFIAKSEDTEKYSWAKWLPHAFIHGSDSRIIGFDENSREKAEYEIASILRRRAESSVEKEQMPLPHIVLFCTSAEIMRNSVLNRYMSSPVYLGITFVLVYGGINMLPNECKAIIECSSDFSGAYMLDGEINDENKIDFDLVSSKDAEKFARTLSGFYVSEESVGSIPQSVDYFEMLGIGRLEEWDLIKRYRINRSYEGLKSLIGFGIGNAPIYLDIHDKKDGPHGLVAGTTGSGKSEILQTFILSLAMNYSPDDAAFVLIDYKGGGMANAFAGLPHIAGMLTNISDEADFSLTRRMCSSLASEIRRRQRIFKEHKLNHIDAYQRLYREGKAEEPMPHLIIISDEFAELRKEQPEFIKELVSVARVGRSLGIHLILATQKPSGVVDDEIWSNSRFRICLRVQDKQDSTGMIKRPDAAYITETGRAFLQIGNDEIFEEFQSGYSGGKYIPKDNFISDSDSEAAIIDINAAPAVVHSGKAADSDAPSELEAAVKFICHVVSKEKDFRPASALWLPPLSKNIPLDSIEYLSSDGISAVYGIADDYEQQKQYPLAIDFMNCTNLKICGASGSGKTTLLQTLLCSLSKRYSPEQTIFYILDFSSRTFKSFKKLPHCGGVCYEEERDAIMRLLKLIDDTVSERKKLFEMEEVGSFGEYVKKHTLPLMLLAIDNFAAFSELYEELTEPLLKLTHDGTRYGIQVIVTINNTSELKYKMRAYINNSIALRMAEKSEYSELIGKNPAYLPSSVGGRGLFASGDTVIEFQAALPARGETEYERSENMKKLFSEISGKYKESKRAAFIPVISENAKYSDVLAAANTSEILPIGYDHETVAAFGLNFSEFYCCCISDNGFDGISLFMDNVTEYALQNSVQVKNVRLNNSVKYSVLQDSEEITDIEGLRSLSAFLFEEFSKRNRAVSEWNKDGKGMTRDQFMSEKFGRLFILIDDMYEFCRLAHSDTESKVKSDIMDYLTFGKDHGVHFFGGYNSGRKPYLDISEMFRKENCGIHFGGKINEQSILTFNMPLPLKLKELPEERGNVVINNKITEIYMPKRKG